jgi:hypothetical protein
VRRRSRVVELSAGPVLCAGEARRLFVRQGANHVEGFVRPVESCAGGLCAGAARVCAAVQAVPVVCAPWGLIQAVRTCNNENILLSEM